MPDRHKPRSGSMQYWPRKRAKRIVPRVRAWAASAKPQLLGFAGYKAGMTHVLIEDTRKNSVTKGDKVSVPVSIIECPPVKIESARFYKMVDGQQKLIVEIAVKADKELSKKIPTTKKDPIALDSIKFEEFDEVRVNVYTQPKMTGIGKKKPEYFEVAIGGTKEKAFEYVKENLGKEISIKDVFAEGQLVDTHLVTTGKGYQGPIKRFGISIRRHKSEKTKRGPGSVCGGWKAQGHMQYRVAHAGQMGFHTRTEYNKQIMMIGDNPEKINPQGGFIRYGVVKNTYLLVKGSVGGPKKRLVRLCLPMRKNKKVTEEPQRIIHISLDSKQGK